MICVYGQKRGRVFVAIGELNIISLSNRLIKIESNHPWNVYREKNWFFARDNENCPELLWQNMNFCYKKKTECCCIRFGFIVHFTLSIASLRSKMRILWVLLCVYGGSIRNGLVSTYFKATKTFLIMLNYNRMLLHAWAWEKMTKTTTTKLVCSSSMR